MTTRKSGSVGDDTLKNFGNPAVIGDGVILCRDTQTYTPYRWVGGKIVLGESQPLPENAEGIERYIRWMTESIYPRRVKTDDL